MLQHSTDTLAMLQPPHIPLPVPCACSASVAAAIASNNLLLLAQNSEYLAQLKARLIAAVPSKQRDALDMAGKLPLAIKTFALGILPAEFDIDPAMHATLLATPHAKMHNVLQKVNDNTQAAGGSVHHIDLIDRGGVEMTSSTDLIDIQVRPHRHTDLIDRGGVEIKGAKSYRYDKSFHFSRLRPGTPFEHLLLVARRQAPADWTDVRELDKYFWLGHVSRADFDAALEAKKQKESTESKVKRAYNARNTGVGARVPVSQSSAELRASLTIGSRRQGWLSACVQWVSFRMLDRAWWDTHVLGGGRGS